MLKIMSLSKEWFNCVWTVVIIIPILQWQLIMPRISRKRFYCSENCRYLHRSKDVLHMMEIKCQAFIYNSIGYEGWKQKITEKNNL